MRTRLNKIKDKAVQKRPFKRRKIKKKKNVKIFGSKPLHMSINLSILANGMPGLTPALGQTFAEAAAVCLEHREHQPGVRLMRDGLSNEDIFLHWPQVDEQNRRSYADLQEATEKGACGLALLVIHSSTGLLVIERSRKGTGFDYWLAKDDGPELDFGGKIRLEVSGILSGTPLQIETRIKQKKSQMKPSDHMAAGLVAVVEFGRPVARVENR